MRAGVFVNLLLVACASQQKLPPGNELENPENEAGEQNTVNQSRMPNSSTELAKAFDGPDPAKPKAQQSNVPKPAPVTDEMASVREAFQQELNCAKNAVASQAEDAAGQLESLERDAQRLGPAEVQSVLELAVKNFTQLKDWRGARKASERWLNACGPEHVESCRAKALQALAKVGAQKDKPAEATAAKNFATAIHTADECLQQAEAAARAKAPLPGCLEGALATYRGRGDKLMVQRGQISKGLEAATDSKKKQHALSLYEHAASTCDEQRCVNVRRRALKLAGWLAMEDDLHRSAKLMLEEAHLSATTMPDDKRRYARTPEVEKVCAALDAKEGAGACRKLEKQVTGDYMFKDFSTQKAGTGLKPDTVREVNEHYGVILQECLAQQAERLVPPAYETYQVEWMVNNDGHVDQVHMAHRDQDNTPLAECLRAQFAWWRYPRYDGEAQHVEQSFIVSARERR
jgi:hypothetical protein